MDIVSATSSSQHEVPGVTTSDLGKDKNDEEKRIRMILRTRSY